MHTVDTTITIAAPPETVWEMIVAFDKYHEWNPFILDGEVRRSLAVGSSSRCGHLGTRP